MVSRPFTVFAGSKNNNSGIIYWEEVVVGYNISLKMNPAVLIHFNHLLGLEELKHFPCFFLFNPIHLQQEISYV